MPSGNTCIDYMIVSDQLRVDPELSVDTDAPFAPHIGIHLHMHVAPAAVLAFRPVQAPALPLAKVTDVMWVRAAAQRDAGSQHLRGPGRADDSSRWGSGAPDDVEAAIGFEGVASATLA